MDGAQIIKVIAGVVLLVTLITFFMAVGHPLFDLLKDAFGASAAVAGIMTHILQYCNKNLVACILIGVGSLGMGVLFSALVARIRAGSDAPKSAVEAEAGSGKSGSEMTSESLDYVEKAVERANDAREARGDAKMTPEEDELFRKSAAPEIIEKVKANGINKSKSQSAADKQSMIKELEAQRQADVEKAKEEAQDDGMDEENADEVQDEASEAVNELVPEE